MNEITKSHIESFSTELGNAQLRLQTIRKGLATEASFFNKENTSDLCIRNLYKALSAEIVKLNKMLDNAEKISKKLVD